MTVFRTLKCVTLLFLSFGFLGCTFGPSPQSLQADPSATPTLETARTVFEDRTRITHDPWYGTQIEYHRSDGKSFLWFPRNTRPVPANWEVRNHGFGQGGHEICWQYPSTSKNAVTGAKGGNWECYPDSTYNANLTAVLQGDPFDLASNRVPFRIPSTRKYSAENLMTTAKRDPTNLRYIYRKQ